MLYKFTDYRNNTTKAFTNPILLRAEVIKITNSSEEAQSVLEWATTPVFGGYRYDHNDFTVEIITQD